MLEPESKAFCNVYSFDGGIDLIVSVVGGVDPAAPQFVRMWAREKWVEAGRSDAKRPGA